MQHTTFGAIEEIRTPREEADQDRTKAMADHKLYQKVARGLLYIVHGILLKVT